MVNLLQLMQRNGSTAKIYIRERLKGSTQETLWGDDGSARGILLVGSTARSGTSFIGEILAQLKPSIYFFEPELFVTATTKELVKEEAGMALLEEVFNCHFSWNFTSWLQTRSRINIVRHTTTWACPGGKRVCLSPTALTRACQNEHIRVMKVVRIRMGWLRRLLDNPSLIHIKVIHLVRDPRGSLYSMDRYYLHKLDPGYYCPLVHDDLVHTHRLVKEYPGRVYGLVYERFCLDPYGEATRMWQFLMDRQDATLPNIWSRYLEQHTHINPKRKKRQGMYTTERETATQYQAWRSTIPQDMLVQIEKFCDPVISALGYNLFGFVDNARNLSLPLFADEK